MDKNSDDHFLIIQATIGDNRQASYDNMKTYDSKIDNLMKMIKKMMVQNQNFHSSSDKVDSPKTHYPTTVVLY